MSVCVSTRVWVCKREREREGEMEREGREREKERERLLIVNRFELEAYGY